MSTENISYRITVVSSMLTELKLVLYNLGEIWSSWSPGLVSFSRILLLFCQHTNFQSCRNSASVYDSWNIEKE